LFRYNNMFKAEIGEEIVDLKTGAKFKVADGALDLDETKYGRMTPGTQATPADIQAGAAGRVGTAPPPGNLPAPPQDLIPPAARQEGQQRSLEDAYKTSGQLTRNVLVPAAQTALAIGTGGQSIPIQMAIGMGTEAALQQTGLSPESPGQIALQGAMPIVGRGIEAFKGISRGVANVMGRSQKAGEQAIASRLGVPGEAVERAYATPKSTALYKAAEEGGEISTQGAREAIREAISKETQLGSQANRQTLKYLQGIESDLTEGTIRAEEAVARAQRLAGKTSEAFKGKRPTEGAGLQEATGRFKETIPGLKEADIAYTRERAVDDIFGAVRKTKKVEAIDNLLAGKGGDRLKSAMSKDEIRDLRLIASRMVSETADPGMLKWLHSTAVKSFLADPNGLTVFRHAFGPTMDRLSPQRLAGLMTFIRAYNAQKENK
jgi:hypothetical protein